MLNVISGQFSEGTVPTTNSYESIATVTASGGESSITFSSIPSTYKHLQIRVLGRHSANGTTALLQFNSDTGSNYNQHQLYGDGGSAGASASAPSTSIWTEYAVNTATVGVAVIDVLDYANTSKFKTVRTLTGSDNNGSGYVLMRSGAWRSTSAVSTITFTLDAGNFAQYSSFALYGIKG